ncbi:aminopeptidase [Salisediminibacterium halotolerans]|uniref:aminopeptidase n=1 Tax=Salisediminibacterium halotolerans TaxID=517425 RepID=UPI000EAF0D10|nr:aminopeptidase [Salisediminibacterium halotolerans]RLJ69394.1 aminopeptidase [Actinophytocola xinjiangensis]RPE83980.1 aminopeptidase [Salisediminibacterium halotolerans]TWG32469.1 aminopeptidase [Salisediminibacterium halotolerans]GEL08054.1 aminopeptidase [Salisediminibacterium halotolerans]
MRDERLNQLAKNLIRYSVDLQHNENILIENFGVKTELVKALVEEAYKCGAHPFISLKEPEINRTLLMNATQQQQEQQAAFEAEVMTNMDAYIGLRSGDNINELADVPSEKMSLHQQTVGTKVHREIRVPNTKWVVLRYPNPSMAQLANMSTEAFEDFYFNVCTLDYSKMDAAMDALVRRMETTDKVRITGEGTDISFSIKDIPAIKCAGKLNIPDGEVYTAPVRESIEGTITYNTASPYQGTTFDAIRFTFEQGKIIAASANNTDRLNEILDTDEGARYIGEFAIGVNPYIQHPMQDILFDEKIDGSFHFTPGQAYENADNGNKSAIHWDIVSIQRPEYGGGRIYFDDELIREDGRFVTDDLAVLNPENLK